jgi:hypothetical protein
VTTEQKEQQLKRSTTAGLAVGMLVIGLGACDQARDFLAGDPPGVPSAAELASYYANHGGVSGIEVSGNVAEVQVVQDGDQLARGGSLWARVGPFVYLFTPATRSVFEDHPAIAAVRVITLTPDGSEVARAMLRRDALNDARWRRSLNILGLALQEGHEHPRRLEALTDWGEGLTEYRYNPDYVSR